MGFRDAYCCFCAGPLKNAHEEWLEAFQQDNTLGNPDGFPAASAPREEIVSIAKADGEFWDDWVSVGPLWKDTEWVSPPCADFSYGMPMIHDGEDWENWWATELEGDDATYMCIHRGCLSSLYRRLKITPQSLWETFYGREGPDPGHFSSMISQLHCVRYYDIEGRQGQFFQYALEKISRSEDGKRILWYDPVSMYPCQWLLARPTVLPKLDVLSRDSMATWIKDRSISTSNTAFLKALTISELLDHILSFLESPTPSDPEPEFITVVPHPHMLSTLLSLFATNRTVHHLLLQRQDIFFRLTSQSGWMLPASPFDWIEWKAKGNPSPIHSLSLSNDLDWRRYILACTRLEDPHVRNRFRFHRMHVQFATSSTCRSIPESEWTWSVGKMDRDPSLCEPEAQDWEVTPPVPTVTGKPAAYSFKN